jgi:hypothetical protein
MESVFFDFPPLPQALQQVARLSEPQFSDLRASLTGPDSFDSDYVRCKQLASQLGGRLSAHDVSNIIRSVWFLKNRFRDWEESDSDPRTAVHELFEFIGLDKFIDEDMAGDLYPRVGELLADDPAAESRYVVQWLQTGIIDTAIDFDSFVDLRPRFSGDLATIAEFIPVVIFRAEVENDNGDTKSHVFQLTTDGVEVLRAVLNNIDDQLAAVRANRALGLRPRIPTVSEADESG